MVYAVAAVLMVIGVSLFVAAPLVGGFRMAQERSVDPELARLEHERALALQGLRELEFDREMDKVSEDDCRELRQQLENKALAAMAALEKLQGQSKAAATRTASARPGLSKVARRPIPQARFCPGCGTKLASAANFCAGCGMALQLIEGNRSKSESA
jgi:hypothetical protein